MNPHARWVLLAIAIAGAIGLALMYPHVEQAFFFRAYLFAFLCTLGVSLGSLALVLLHNLTGGEWGDGIRPTLHAAMLTLPLVMVLFIPIALGLPALYPWARPDAGANELLAHRMPYLNVPFFLARAAAYFILWIVLMFLVLRPRPVHRGLNAGGLILYLFTMTHAGFDWIMSRETEFYSTTFGFVVTLGQTLSALALGILFLPRRQPPREPGPSNQPQTGLFNDVGNVMLTLVILWAYVSFMQFLVVWMGNTQEDNAWYLKRGLAGGGALDEGAAWRLVGLGLIVFHFCIPFFVLLFRAAKQRRHALGAIAGLLLLAHIVHDYWLVAPADLRVPLFNPNLVDATALATLGCLWLFVFLTIRARRPAYWHQMPPVEEAHAHG